MADLLPPPTTEQADENVDNSNLTCPVRYEDVDIEAYNLLYPGYVKGLKLNYSPAFFEKFDISSTMGPEHYEFKACYSDPKFVFTGNVTTHGRLFARVRASITDKLIVSAKTELRKARLWALVNFEYMALNYRAKFLLGNMGLIGATCIQRVTPRLSLGSEFLCTSVDQSWGVGYSARYETADKMIASAQVSMGDVLMTYVHKISKKVSLATDFAYNCFSRDVIASVGYDCNSGQSRVQGKIDSNGVAYAFLQKKWNMGLEYQLSASLDLNNKDYSLGLSLKYDIIGKVYRLFI